MPYILVYEPIIFLSKKSDPLVSTRKRMLALNVEIVLVSYHDKEGEALMGLGQHIWGWGQIGQEYDRTSLTIMLLLII